MAIKKVLMIGNQKLREKSLNVTDFTGELLEVTQDLKNTLLYLQKEKNIGRALAAPQIGHMKKVVYYNSNYEEIIMLILKLYGRVKRCLMFGTVVIALMLLFL